MSAHGPDAPPRRTSGEVIKRSRQLVHARPLHAVAFGLAIAAACGAVVFGLTVAEVVQTVHGQFHTNLSLLAEFFPGYSVTWAGALIGLLWGAAVGFAIGWGLAAIRNRMLAGSLYTIRKRARDDGLDDALHRR